MQINWQCKPFHQLNTDELYAVIQLRNEVFVVEQKCVFQDADNKDQQCHHLMGWVDQKLAAYARLVPSGVAYSQVSIGRIVTSPGYRKAGAGKALMVQAINTSYQLFGKLPIKIGAQLYLKNFYSSFGFSQTSDMYPEDDIPHIEMVLEP